MYRKICIYISIVLLLCSNLVKAQLRSGTNDSLSIYREFIQIGSWYKKVPLSLTIHFVNRIFPSAGEQDSVSTDMTLYYGKSEFYMKAEGLEQIVNDSMMVLVNNDAKMIKLYPNTNQLQSTLGRTAAMFTPDSSFQSLVKKYSASETMGADNIKQIVLRTRDNVSGTSEPREQINVRFLSQNFQPVSFEQSKSSLVPIDSLVYKSLINDAQYTGKLVAIVEKGISLFFILKTQRTYCRLERIDRELSASPVKQEDRIVRTVEGEYEPVKTLSGYLLSKEY